MLDILPIVLSLIATAVSLFTYFWQKRLAKVRGTRDFNLSWIGFNSAMLSDRDFIQFEIQLHPYGELDELGVKRMYFYFLRFNNVYSIFKGQSDVNGPLAMSALRTEANISFPDRAFIRQHVFERGYDKDFADFMEGLWLEILESGATLAMYGDKEEKGVKTIASSS